MQTKIKFLTLTVAALATANVSSGQGVDHPNIKELLTAEQYKNMGLNQLSPSQQEALSQWLDDYVRAQSSTTVAASAIEPDEATDIAANSEQQTQPLDKNWGFSNPPEDEEEKNERLYANIEGKFRGWSGKTVFRLDNGQVWRQRRSGRFFYSGDARRVEIGKNSWGFYEMKLIEADRSVGVSRIK